MMLWLDDERPAPEGWYWIKTAREAIGILKTVYTVRTSGEGMESEFTHMSFDHDLADVHYAYWQIGHAMGDVPEDDPRRVEARARAAREQTGYDVLLWMAEHEVWPTEECMVHSHNPVGAERMVGVINRYGPYEQKVSWTPYVGPDGTWA